MRTTALVPIAQGIGSQGLSSLSNFALTVAVAHASSPEEFGAFAVAHSLAVLAIPIVRSSVGETLAVTDHAGRAGMGAGAIAGVVVGACLAVGAFLAAGPLAGWLGAFALAVPLMVLQDTARSVAFARHRPAVAVRSDAVWLAVQTAGWAVAVAFGQGTVVVLFAIWVVGALSGTLAVLPTVEVPSPAAGARWLRVNRRVVSGLTVDTVLAMAPHHGTLYTLGITAGLPAAGAMRGMETLYGPIRSALLGVRAVGLPEASRRKADGRRRMHGYVVRMTVAMVTLAAAVATALSFLPDSVGRLALDEVWVQASTVAVPIGVGVVCTAALTGVRLSLRALHALRELLMLRTFHVTLATVAGVGGAVVGGLQAAAWGLAVAAALAVVMGWAIVVRTPDRQHVPAEA